MLDMKKILLQRFIDDDEILSPSTPPPPTGLIGHGLIAVDNKIYLIGGRNGSNVFVADTYCYNPKLDHWAKLTDCPIPIAYQSVATDGSAIYLYGGATSGVVGINALYRLNLNNLTWDVLSSYGSVTSNTASAISNGVLYNQANRKYLISEDLWSTHSGLPQQSDVSYGQYANTLYFFGGKSGTTSVGNSQYMYNLETLSLESFTGTRPSARYTAGGCASSEGFYVYGGTIYGFSAIYNELWFFNNNTRVWSKIITSKVIPGVAHTRIAFANNCVYIFGGMTGSTVNTVQYMFWKVEKDGTATKLI